LLNIFAIMLYS